LRLKENVDSEYALLLDALNKLIAEYRGKDSIPKDLSYAFLNISNHFEFSDKLYNEKELEHIEDMRDNLPEKLIEFYES
jgi:hypothetical protein